MYCPEFRDLQGVRINPDLLSRGTGEAVPLGEATVYDFMPPILGNRFRVDPTLRRGVHFFSDAGSFMMGEEAFQELATNELNAGNLVPALEAYKRGLHKAVGFAGAMAMLGDRALLNQAEIDRFNLPRRFGAIESGMISMIVGAGEDTKIDLPAYAAWVAGVRTLERDARTSASDWTQLRDVYARMQKYGDAANVSEWLGDSEAEKRYRELAKTDPKKPRGYEKILRRIDDEYEESHRPHVTFPPKE